MQIRSVMTSYCLQLKMVKKGVILFLLSGLSLRAGGRGFSPATKSLSPGYFDTKQKYWKEEKYIKIQNYELKNKPIAG